MTVRMRAFLLVTPVIVSSFIAAAIQTAGGNSFFRDSEALGALAFIGFAVVGGLILAADGSHRMGRVFYGAGWCAVVTWGTDNYARYSVEQGRDLPGELFAAWMQNWTWFVPIGLIFTVGLMLFPSGHPPGPRWRPVVWFASASLALLTIAFMLHSEPLDGFEMRNPTGVISDEIPLAGVAFAGVVLSVLAGMIALGTRFKRSRGIERLQIKWVFYAATMMVLVNLGLPVIGAQVSERATDLLFGSTTLLLPIACGVAILKYRLYDIDVIVNRTLVYGSLTVILAFSYLLIVVLMQGLMEPVTRDSDLAIAASTLAVAALFRPLRSRVQAFIDQRFYRRKYDAAQTLSGFSSRLREEVDLNSLRVQLVGVVAQTMQPAHASVWLRDMERGS